MISNFFPDITGHGHDLKPHFLLAAIAEELQPPGAVTRATRGAGCEKAAKIYKFLEKICP